jgi:hypothetical protein
MTHTLHRQGTEQNLKNDFVVLAKAANGINEKGAAEKLQQFLRMALRHKAVNIGHGRAGNMYAVDPEEVITKTPDVATVTVVLDNEDELQNFIKELKEADLGVSIVISSLFKASMECCRKAGIMPHTIEHSLGIWGNTEKLPPKEVLEVTTMCGHGLISTNLVASLVEDLKKGRTTAEAASKELAKQCACGILNPVRASQLLQGMAGK